MNLTKFATLIAAGALIALPAFAATVILTGPGYNYKLWIPPNWERTPQAVLDAVNAAIPGQTSPTYDMKLEPRKAGLRDPWVFVQVNSSKDTGMTGLPSEAAFKAFVAQAFGGRNIADERRQIATTRSDQMRRSATIALNAISASTVHVDIKRREFWFAYTSADSGGVTMTSLTVGRFLPDGSEVTFDCGASAATFAKELPTFERIIDSLDSAVVKP